MSDLIERLEKAAKDAMFFAPDQVEDTLYWVAAARIKADRERIAALDGAAEKVIAEWRYCQENDRLTLDCDNAIELLKAALAEGDGK